MSLEFVLYAVLALWLSGIPAVARGIYCSNGRKMDWIMAAMAAVPWPLYLIAKPKKFWKILSCKYDEINHIGAE